MSEGGGIPNLHLETPTVTLEQRYEGTNVTEEDIERQNAFESGVCCHYFTFVSSACHLQRLHCIPHDNNPGCSFFCKMDFECCVNFFN